MDFVTSDYGAVGDGETNDTKAIQAAIDACHATGGGRVVVGAGLHALATVELKSNTELHLDEGAVLQGIFDSPDYRPVCPDSPRPGPVEHGNMTALLFARDATNVAITGAGTIDGQGYRYWRQLDGPRSGRPDIMTTGVRQFWYEHICDLGKPHRLLAFFRCDGVTIRGVHLTGATAWTCHLLSSRNIEIDRVDIRNPLHGPNTDGIDVDGSSDVRISNCRIETGDDAVVLKTTGMLNTNTGIRNVRVSDCQFVTNCNGLKIGTETMHDIEDVIFRDTTISSRDGVETVERCISGIAIESVDGGHVRNIACRNITITNARSALFLRLGARLRGGAPMPGTMRDIELSNIVATGAIFPSVVSGLPGHRIEDLRIRNLSLAGEGGCSRTPDQIGPIPECPAKYPEVFMFGTVPASLLYFRHVQRLSIESLQCHLLSTDARPPVFTEDAEIQSGPHSVSRPRSGEDRSPESQRVQGDPMAE